MSFERHHSAMIAASIVTVASFVGATIYTQNRLARLDALSAAIETAAVPSIRYLSRAAVRLTRLNQWLGDLAAVDRQRTPALTAARAEVAALNDDVSQYLRLTPLPGERAFWTALHTDVDQAVGLVRSALDAEERGGQSPGDLAADARANEAVARTLRTVLATLDFDVGQTEAMARDVRDVRATTFRTTVALDAAATVIALFGVFVAYRASRRHDELLDRHSTLLAARVAELDRFAGRVAHDVLSPLGTIAAGLSLLERSSDERGRTYIDRSFRALQHVQQLVEGLLSFARSGASPEPSAKCSLDAVFAAVAADCSEAAAEKGIDLIGEAAGAVQVPCSLGVTTSIVQNLVWNAIKYMGTSPVKRIVVRASAAGARARIEVEDTGPGIPFDLQAAIFEPFVRGPHETVNGTGLGLSTVKRLAESHGGAVGVRSTPGAGSVFWVDLPLVAASDAAPSAASPTAV